jgi:hypothetical protein
MISINQLFINKCFFFTSAAVCHLEEAISKQQLDWRKEERGEILKGLGEEKSRIKKLYMRQKQP